MTLLLFYKCITLIISMLALIGVIFRCNILAIISICAIDFLFPDISLGPFPIRSYLSIVIIGFLIISGRIIKKYNHDECIIISNISILIFHISIVFFFGIIFFSAGWNEIRILFGRFIASLITILIGVNILETNKEIKCCFVAIVFIGFINAIIGLMQTIGIESAWNFVLKHSDYNTIIVGYENFSRAIGLSQHSVVYACQIAIIAPMALALAIQKDISIKIRYFFIISTLLIYLAAACSGTRSLVVSVLIAGIWVIASSNWIYIKYRIFTIFSFCLIFIAGLIALANHSRFNELALRYSNPEYGLKGRLVMYDLIVDVISLYPFGGGQFSTLWRENSFMPPHNHILLIGLYWGIPGLLLFLFLAKYSIFPKNKYYKKNKLFFIDIGCAGSFIAVIGNGMLHNSGIYSTFPYMWWPIIIQCCARRYFGMGLNK